MPADLEEQVAAAALTRGWFASFRRPRANPALASADPLGLPADGGEDPLIAWRRRDSGEHPVQRLGHDGRRGPLPDAPGGRFVDEAGRGHLPDVGLPADPAASAPGPPGPGPGGVPGGVPGGASCGEDGPFSGSGAAGLAATGSPFRGVFVAGCRCSSIMLSSGADSSLTVPAGWGHPFRNLPGPPAAAGAVLRPLAVASPSLTIDVCQKRANRPSRRIGPKTARWRGAGSGA
jgi:hypothetical protein